MTVYFANKGTIDLAAIMTMGVSVKDGDQPIGYFGTGLKFAIATLLRTGHRVVLHRAGDPIEFTAKPTTIRGVPFEIVHMDDQPLGYTTALGKNWEPWQAYRELRSNAIDEAGDVYSHCAIADWDTVFAVSGAAIEDAHRKRAEIFLETRPLKEGVMCSIHPGSSAHGYYRGIRALALRWPSMLTYNLVCDQTLTEDRTLASPHALEMWAADAVAEMDDERVIEEVLFAKDDWLEHRFNFADHSTPSDAFMRVVERHAHNARVNRTAVDLWRKRTKREVAYSPVALDALEQRQAADALAMCNRLNCPITMADFAVVEDLGADVLGLVRDSRILIARRCFDMGVRTLAGTLFEEWLHLKHRKQDCSREMQNFLLDALLACVAKLMFAEKQDERSAAIVREPAIVRPELDEVPF
jgi:hypothetical protein